MAGLCLVDPELFMNILTNFISSEGDNLGLWWLHIEIIWIYLLLFEALILKPAVI